MKKIVGVVLASMLTFGLIGCSSETEKENDMLTVTTTTAMIGDAIEEIGGDVVEVTSLMKPGVDPHLYKASQGDIRKLNEADVIFYNGLHLEGKMQEILESIGEKKPVFAVGDSVNKADILYVEEAKDPHIWFDVSLWIQAVEGAVNALIEVAPEHKELFTKNGEAYIAELKQLDTFVASEIATVPKAQRKLITAHDAFGYFGKRYDIEVLGLQGISTAAEFGASDVIKLRDYVIENGVKAVFVESSVSEKAINALVEGAKEKGSNIKIGGKLYSDSMGEAGTEEGTYIGMVKHNVNTIVSALK